MMLNPNELELLKQVVKATDSNGLLYATTEQMAPLLAQALVEGNKAMVHPDNSDAYAFRARPEALVYLQNQAAAASTAWGQVADAPSVAVAAPAAPVAAPVSPTTVSAPSAAAGGFTIIKGFQLPTRTLRKAAGSSRNYPFETLALDEAFFVAATEKKPDPKKSLASTVSSANARYKEFSPRRYFKVVRAVEGQLFGAEIAPSNGAYIVRVEPPVDTDSNSDI